MFFADPPAAACWHHRGLRSGFEVVYFGFENAGWHIAGTTTGLQAGDAWVVSYEIELDSQWRTRTAHVTARTPSGFSERRVEADGVGHWWVDAVEAPHLAGCLDIDLESSAMTNAFPVRRLGLAVGERADAPASYFHVDTATIDRLDQTYVRIEDAEGCLQYAYEAPAFAFACRLVYDTAGLVLDYPGIGARAT